MTTFLCRKVVDFQVVNFFPKVNCRLPESCRSSRAPPQGTPAHKVNLQNQVPPKTISTKVNFHQETDVLCDFHRRTNRVRYQDTTRWSCPDSSRGRDKTWASCPGSFQVSGANTQRLKDKGANTQRLKDAPGHRTEPAVSQKRGRA